MFPRIYMSGSERVNDLCTEKDSSDNIELDVIIDSFAFKKVENVNFFSFFLLCMSIRVQRCSGHFILLFYINSC